MYNATLMNVKNLSVDSQTGVYFAGMPQLAYQGLSENWLLKECGHRHWMGLASLSGKRQPDFCDLNGNKSYAAFTAVRITSAKLHEVVENQRFSISSQVSKAGQARYYSSHQLISGSDVSHIEMLSTFVFRREAGNNQTVSRANFINPNISEPEPEASELMQQVKIIRTEVWDKYLGVLRSSKSTLKEIEFSPCPNNDFNGANFLYFASFQAFIDRAEWAWFNAKDLPSISDRHMFFYGNINVGDKLKIRLCAINNNAKFITHWCEIYGNGLKIADVFTRKQRI